MRGICLKDFSSQGGSQVVGKHGRIDNTNTELTGLVVFYPDDQIPYRCNFPKEWVKEEHE